MIKYLCILLILLSAAAVGHSNTIPAAGDTGNVAITPPPPDSTSTCFSGDFYRWIWGKQQRATEQGELASHYSECNLDRLCDIYSQVLDIEIDQSNTQAIYSLLSHVSQACLDDFINVHQRKRPFVLMNEQPWGENEIQANLSDSTSFPSAHAEIVWSTALALAQMAPHQQDTILKRAIECANSGVITGAHWQSDVDAALIYGSAALAKAQGSDLFPSLMAAARSEYMQLTGLSESDLTAPFPSLVKILDAPPTADDYFFASDLFKFWQSKELRSTERGEMANNDESITDDYLVSIFAACSPVVTISESNTPQIVMLIKALKLSLYTLTHNLKSIIYRERPYVKYNEPVVYGSYDWSVFYESSYPSRHALIGWGIALALAEVMHDCQNVLLKRGYEYGESRIIKGSSYASDVHAARIMAACYLSKLHNETLFKNLFANAKAEYQQKLDEAGIESIVATSRINDKLWYSISGIIYKTKPTTPGIYIHNGKKVTIK